MQSLSMNSFGTSPSMRLGNYWRKTVGRGLPQRLRGHRELKKIKNSVFSVFLWLINNTK